jgi:pyruvoyl-dependent arginine decarboxylase (PvlArgDC)
MNTGYDSSAPWVPKSRIALTADEKELWLAHCANSALHVFNSSVMPPDQLTTIKVREWPSCFSAGTLIVIAAAHEVAARLANNFATAFCEAFPAHTTVKHGFFGQLARGCVL